MIEFDWDDEKTRQNLRKHGVSFEQATQAFRDPMGVEWIDDSEVYGEERAVLLGMAGTVFLWSFTLTRAMAATLSAFV